MSELPVEVKQSLDTFVEAAKAAFGPDLVAVVLFGSAAEGTMRASSDVNILLVLKKFEAARADQVRDPLRLAHAAVQLNAMFVLENEVPAAMEAFAVKFADIAARHQVLYGADPFSTSGASREALIRRLKQVLLNLQLRMRERYVMLSLREEQLVLVIADAAGPLRASAASLLQLEGHGAHSQGLTPKLALESVAASLNDPAAMEALHTMSTAREQMHLSPGQAAPALIKLLELIEAMRARVERLA